MQFVDEYTWRCSNYGRANERTNKKRTVSEKKKNDEQENNYKEEIRRKEKDLSHFVNIKRTHKTPETPSVYLFTK